MPRNRWLALAPLLELLARAAHLPELPGTRRYEGYNCYEKHGGQRLQMGSAYGNPFPGLLSAEECHDRCLKEDRCEAFLIVGRHVEDGHPADGPCWLRTKVDVESCLQGHAQGAEPYDLFVIPERVGGRLSQGQPLQHDYDHISNEDCEHLGDVTISGLTGDATWGNGEYHNVGHECGHPYWRKKSCVEAVTYTHAAYLYRGGEEWFVGDQRCSTEKYWAKGPVSSDSACPEFLTLHAADGSQDVVVGGHRLSWASGLWRILLFVVLPLILLCCALMLLLWFCRADPISKGEGPAPPVAKVDGPPPPTRAAVEAAPPAPPPLPPPPPPAEAVAAVPRPEMLVEMTREGYCCGQEPLVFRPYPKIGLSTWLHPRVNYFDPTGGRVRLFAEEVRMLA